jgi:predicted dehydrogenase
MKNAIFAAQLVMALVLPLGQPQTPQGRTDNAIRLVTLDPGHFHAALVQKSMYDGVDTNVHVYAPPGPDVQLHLDRIHAFNARAENPTRWQEKVYTGRDFFERMLAEKAGNVVVLSGNNEKKMKYIAKSLEAGFHVLADKPMAINGQDFKLLLHAFATAKRKNLLLYDIMTERFEITTVLQKELSMIPEIFGVLEEGTPDHPAVTKESVHHFYKHVSGEVLTRPAWFLDVSQQGEGIVDVTTHLVDLVQWECFPGEALNYEKDIQVKTARRWPTRMTLSEFTAITRLDHFPEYLRKDVVNDSVLQVYCNGEINYTLRGVHAKVSVTWAYKAPEGAGDTHHSVLRGTKANLLIKQGAGQGFKPTLYILPIVGDVSYESILLQQMKRVQEKYPGVEVKKSDSGWEVIMPERYREGHEAHFARVTEKFLEYLQDRDMPEWEVPNMLAKYYTTITAFELAKEQ